MVQNLSFSCFRSSPCKKTKKTKKGFWQDQFSELKHQGSNSFSQNGKFWRIMIRLFNLMTTWRAKRRTKCSNPRPPSYTTLTRHCHLHPTHLMWDLRSLWTKEPWLGAGNCALNVMEAFLDLICKETQKTWNKREVAISQTFNKIHQQLHPPSKTCCFNCRIASQCRRLWWV